MAQTVTGPVQEIFPDIRGNVRQGNVLRNYVLQVGHHHVDGYAVFDLESIEIEVSDHLILPNFQTHFPQT